MAPCLQGALHGQGSACFPVRHSGSGRFGMVEPPRTHSKLPCRPASPSITVVRCGRTSTNSLETDLLPPSSQWFGKVRCSRNSPNSLRTACRPPSPCISGSGRFGVVEPPRTHSNLPCRPPSPCITVVRCGRNALNLLEPAL